MRTLGNAWCRLAFAAGMALMLCGAASSASAKSALALGDYDGDGTDDLAVAYDEHVVVRRGALAAYVPAWSGTKAYAGEAFAPTGEAHAIGSVDWLASGDFDNDGRLDAVAAEHGGRALTLLRGDGRGGFASRATLALPGTIAAFAAGDVDRPDNLTDLVVALVGDDGTPMLEVRAGPLGAWRAEPRVLALPWAPSHLAIAPLDAHFAHDIALAGGDRVALVQGRDPLFPDPAEKFAPVLVEWTLAAPVRALATGDLVRDDEARAELAVLDATGTLHTFASAAATIAPSQRRRRIEAPRLVATRAALSLGRIGANVRLFAGRFVAASVETLVMLDDERIALFIAGAAAKTERTVLDGVTASALAAVPVGGADGRTGLATLDASDRVAVAKGPVGVLLVVNATNDVADGACNAAHCSLREAILAANAVPTDGPAVAIQFNIASASAIPTIIPQQPLPVVTRTLTIDGTTQSAGFVEVSGAAVAVLPDSADGLVFEGPGTVVRGLVVNRFDRYLVVIRGNGSIVEGNRIGSTSAGTGNPAPGAETFAALYVDASGVRVGGTAGTTPFGACTGACNVLAGSSSVGLEGTVGADALVVQGNYFGLAADGVAFLPNESYAMTLRASSTVGGLQPSARNVFGSAGYGGNTTQVVRFE